MIFPTATTISAILFTSVAHGAVQPRDVCNANNCARAVTGTRDKVPNLTSRRALCSSFLLTTVTPATTTSTVTIMPEPTTVTVTATPRWVFPRGGEEKRAVNEPRAVPVTVVPTSVPAYASSCPNASAYRSACSCWGVAPAITEAPTPTAFTTTTLPPAQVTATVTLRCYGQAPKGCHMIPDCASGVGICDCAEDTEGNPFCFQAIDTNCLSYNSCSTNADCSGGERCMAVGSTCCTSAICLPVAAEAECPNRAPPALVRRLLLGLGNAHAEMRREVGKRGGDDDGVEYMDARGALLDAAI